MSASRDSLEAGELPPPKIVGPLCRTDFVRYQGASGDMNPVHHDEDFAKNAGYPAPLAVGMFAAGAMNSYGTDWLGAENIRRTRMRWKAPAFPGYVLTISAAIAKLYEDNGEDKVDIELTVTDQTEAISVQGWMTFVIPKRGLS